MRLAVCRQVGPVRVHLHSHSGNTWSVFRLAFSRGFGFIFGKVGGSLDW